MPRSFFARPADLPTSRPRPGLTQHFLQGARTTVQVMDLDARAIVDTHKHAVEHVGLVIRGSVAMVIAGEQRILSAGDTYVVPAGASHGTRVLEQAAQVVDVCPSGEGEPCPG